MQIRLTVNQPNQRARVTYIPTKSPGTSEHLYTIGGAHPLMASPESTEKP